jgi:sulfate adenylyltransferase subunit 1
MNPSALLDTSHDASPSTPAALPAHRQALRFLTAGSVDDGKSTLIGRLLYDSRAILADQIDTLQARAAACAGTAAAGGPDFDLSLLTDGLEAEREQGITIDVAFRYFATPRRKFIIADAPGHEQYTRNMVTAAAGSDAAVVLVDITKLVDVRAPAGTPLPAVKLLPQTRRHALLAQLLRVPGIVFAVNKLDALAEPGPAFNAVKQALQAFAAEAGISVAAIVPVSALRGDNVAVPLAAAWYEGPSLLQVLEALPSASEGMQTGAGALRLPVQYVAREGGGVGEQPRTFWGRVAEGRVRVGDVVQVFPSGEQATVTALRDANGATAAVNAGRSAGVVLDRQLDVSRGDWLATPGLQQPVRRFEATLAWLDTEPATPGRKYLLRHGHRWVQGRLASIEHRLDIHTLQPTEAHTLAVNEIADVVFELQQPLPLEAYVGHRDAGALIVVDPASHRTSGAALVRSGLAAAAAEVVA